MSDKFELSVLKVLNVRLSFIIDSAQEVKLISNVPLHT